VRWSAPASPHIPRAIRGIGTAELRPSVRDLYQPPVGTNLACACSAGYRMLLLDDWERRTKEGKASDTVAAQSESPITRAASRKGNG
jgi:hypothetical protein